MLKLPDGTVKVLVEGISRAEIKSFKNSDFLLAEAKIINDILPKNKSDLNGMIRAVKSQFGNYAKLNKKITSEILNSIEEDDNPSKISDMVCSNLELDMSSKQKLLELDNVCDRFEKILKLIEEEQGVLQAEKELEIVSKDKWKKHKEIIILMNK